MKLWLQELYELVRFILAKPSSSFETLVMTVAALFFLAAAIKLTSGPFGLTLNPWIRVIPIAVGGTLLALAAVTAVRIYALPSITSASLRFAIQVAVPLVIIAAVVTPSLMLLLKGNYLECLLTIAVSILAMALLTTAARGVWHSVVDGFGLVSLQRDKKVQQERDVNSL